MWSVDKALLYGIFSWKKYVKNEHKELIPGPYLLLVKS